MGVTVITGAGGMGLAIARRVGSGSTLVLADRAEALLEAAGTELGAAGYEVVCRVVDVADVESVRDLAAFAADRGAIDAVVHTAGVSPATATVEAIMTVDLVGTAHVLDAFGQVVADGGAGVFISSMAGRMARLDGSVESTLATTPTGALLALPEVVAVDDPGVAYVFAKRANQLRVQAAAGSWGRRGARVNSISPGVISTAMGVAELDGSSGEFMRSMIAGSASGRIGTPDDIAAAAEFLLSRAASYVTGTDLLVDGGVIASLVAPSPTPG